MKWLSGKDGVGLMEVGEGAGVLVHPAVEVLGGVLVGARLGLCVGVKVAGGVMVSEASTDCLGSGWQAIISSENKKKKVSGNHRNVFFIDLSIL